MNVLQKKKRFIISIISTFLSLVFMGYAYTPYVQHVDALTNVITYNNYGSFSRTNEAFGLSATTASVNLGCSSVVGELNGIYNGVVTINYSIGNGLSIANFSVIPENCHIISYSSSACTIEFYGVSNWSVTFLETQTKNVASLWEDLTIQSLTGWNMTYLERSDSAVMVNIQNRLSDLKTYTDGIEGLLTTNNQLLTTIANNGGSGGSSTVNNIDINVDHIADELSLLKTSNDSILDELLGFFTDGLGQMLTIESVIDAIETTTTALTGIQSQLTSIGTTLNSINTTLNNINTAVQNIDNSIDTISWSQIFEYYGYYNNSVIQGYGSSNSFVYSTPFNLSFRNNPNIIKIRMPVSYYVGNTASAKLLNVRGYSGGNLINLDYELYYIRFGRVYTELYLKINENFDANSYIILDFDKYVTSYSWYISDKYGYYINDNDIEYWNLLNCFNQYIMQNKILDAINSISIQVTPQDITNTNNNINNYNTTMNNIEGIETNIINNLNTDLSNLTLTSNYINPVDANVRTAFDIVIQDFVLDHNYIAGRFYLILVCSLVLLMLGRW